MTRPGLHLPAFEGHVPVMLEEVLAALDVKPGHLVLDGTFGGGGYTSAVLRAAPRVRVIGLDRDPAALDLGRALEEAASGRFSFVEGNFAELDLIADDHAWGGPIPCLDAVVLDVGVSSFQIDQPERGFSFTHDGPLDMRMSSDGPTAADALALLDEGELSAIFWEYGEEREARRVARAIVADRTQTPFTRTAQLSALCARVVGRGGRDTIHPATRVFQALRIFINSELEALHAGLEAAERALKPGGRLVVVSFHSLEDRVVKTFLADRAGGRGGSRHAPALAERAASFETLTRKPLVPGEAETAANPRARSARLRAAVRTAGAAHPRQTHGFAGVPDLERLWRLMS